MEIEGGRCIGGFVWYYDVGGEMRVRHEQLGKRQSVCWKIFKAGEGKKALLDVHNAQRGGIREI